MSFLSILAGSWGSLMGLGNFLQAYKIFKLKEAKEISVVSWSIIFIGAIIWVLYGIEINSLSIIIANIFGIISSATIIIGWILYRKNKH